MSKLPEEMTVYRLEKFIPTHCPKCAHPFRSSAEDYAYDARWRHSQTDAKWLAVFPEAAVAEGLQSEPIWCRRCQNITLRVVTAVRWVATEDEATLLEAEGYANRQMAHCWGTGFSYQPDYTLKVVPNPDEQRMTFTFFPRAMGHRRRPRSS